MIHRRATCAFCGESPGLESQLGEALSAGYQVRITPLITHEGSPRVGVSLGSSWDGSDVEPVTGIGESVTEALSVCLRKIREREA